MLGKPTHQPAGLIVPKDKGASPTWANVKAFLLTFDRAGLPRAGSRPLRCEQGQSSILACTVWLGSRSARPLQNYYLALDKPRPDEEQTVSVSKVKKAIADYDKALGRQEGLAELSIFFCEEAFSFVEGCSFSDEQYFVALIRMYDRSVNRVLSLPLAERRAYVERLGKLRTRAKRVGWGVEDELNDLWHAADFDEQLE